jgi:hypothetical protein
MEVNSLMPWWLYPHGTHWIRGDVGPKAGLDVLEKRKTSCTCWELNPRMSSPFSGYYTGWAILTHVTIMAQQLQDTVP